VNRLTVLERSSTSDLEGPPAAEGVPLKIAYVRHLPEDRAALETLFRRVSELGFSAICLPPVFLHKEGDPLLIESFDELQPRFSAIGSVEKCLAELARLASRAKLDLLLDVVLDRVALDGAVTASAPHLFKRSPPSAAFDPRREDLDAAYFRFDEAELRREIADWWTRRLLSWARSGVHAFRLLGLGMVPAEALAAIVAGVRRHSSGCRFFGWTPGVPWDRLAGLERTGLSAVFSSTPWWDGHASWFIEEYESLRRIAPVIGIGAAPGEDHPSGQSRNRETTLSIAAATGQGLFVALDAASGAEDPDIAAANLLSDRLASYPRGEARALTSPASAVTALLVCDAPDVREADSAFAILLNTDHNASRPIPVALDPLAPAAGAAFGDPVPLNGADALSDLASGEARVLRVKRLKPLAKPRRDSRALLSATKATRVVVEGATPRVDGGFAVKRVIGQRVDAEATVYTDGHDRLGVELLWKAAGESAWNRVPARPLGNDRWTASFTPKRIGRHTFTFEAWRDDFATLRQHIEVNVRANVDASADIEEARRYLRSLLPKASSPHKTALERVLAALDSPHATVAALASEDAMEAVAALEERRFLVQHPPIPLEVERPQAEFSSWYELFPRSQSGSADRHGTFADVIARLPDIRAMGFDVLYFPPIHPIGTTNRKGRNNSLKAEPGDLGSPYAIGSPEGGHDGIHPELGTLADFKKLVAAAKENGLEIALDYAIQCSPDHPWLREHPGWFSWRADGSIRFAENPPKKYEDIVNVDFYAKEALPDLWLALRDIVLFWVEQGVRIFRVDNPHTKPLPFWQWMIADVRGRHPEVIFLSEAFTRPAMMYRLAKLGFSQSYTYFIWRNSKHELTAYLDELTRTEVKEFFRPNFFVNTPDINPHFLQGSGRPGFLIRAVLAATLSGSWGVYSGFEFCEAAPLPGREEYLDSEKYQLRPRMARMPGDIVTEIGKLNRLRRANPALQTHLGVRFYNAFNDQVLVYGKASPSGEDMILIAVNLNPHQAQEATFEVPLWEWGLPDHASVAVEDLWSGTNFVWTGKLQHTRLDPAALPFAVWRIAPLGRGG
jgi:starch synthase (maltosyl-transferring)